LTARLKFHIMKQHCVLYNTRMRTTQPIQSLDRGLVLLEAVAHARRPVSLSELMPVLNIDRSSVFRLANTLVRRGDPLLLFLGEFEVVILPGEIDFLAGLWGEGRKSENASGGSSLKRVEQFGCRSDEDLEADFPGPRLDRRGRSRSRQS